MKGIYVLVMILCAVGAVAIGVHMYMIPIKEFAGTALTVKEAYCLRTMYTVCIIGILALICRK